jgi:hypothetical protein
VVVVQELAGFVAFFDPLLAFFGNLHDVPLFKVGGADTKVFGQSPDVIPTDPHITSHPATQRRAFQTVEPLMRSHTT